MDEFCPVCGIFKEGYIVENFSDEERKQYFPAEFFRLKISKLKDSGKNSTVIKQCPECGLMYEYFNSEPFPMKDKHDIITEKLMPILRKGRHIRKPVAPDEVPVPDYRCPACGSTEVDFISGGFIAGETFINLKCSSCGNEDLLDEFQVQKWHNIKDKE